MILEAIIALAVFGGAFGLGKALLSTLGIKFKDDIQDFSYSLAFGLFLYSLYGFFISFIGVAIPDSFYLLVGLSLIVGLKPIHYELSKKRSLDWTRFETIEKTIVAILALMLLIQFISSLAPPSANTAGPMDWDSLTYHLFAVKQIAATHAFSFNELLPHTNWPMGFEMVYLAAYSIGGAISARILSFFVSLTFLFFLYSFARRFASRKYALYAVAIFSTIPISNAFFGTGYIDLHLAFAVLLSLNALLEYQDTRQKRWLLVSGINAGFAASIKLIGLIYAGVFVLWFLYYEYKNRQKIHHALAKAAAFIALSIGLALPWFVKNFINTGNPVWPLHYGFMNAFNLPFNHASAFFNQVWTNQFQYSGIGHGVIDLLLLPFTTTFYGAFFNGVITPLFFLFLPLAFFVKNINSHIKSLLAICVPFIVFWFYTFQEARFLFPVFAILSIVVAYLLENASLRSKLFDKIVVAILLVTLIGSLGLVTIYKYNSFPVALGLETQDHYLQRTYEPYGVCNYFTSHYSQGNVFALKYEGLYYCERPIYSLYYDYSAFSSSELAQDLKNRGTVAILIPKRASVEQNFLGLILQSKKVYEDDKFELYELN